MSQVVDQNVKSAYGDFCDSLAGSNIKLVKCYESSIIHNDGVTNGTGKVEHSNGLSIDDCHSVENGTSKSCNVAMKPALLLPLITKEPPKGVSQENYENLVASAYAFINALNRCTGNAEDLSREGLLRTPERFARGYYELSSGYKMDFDLTSFALDSGKKSEYPDIKSTTPVVVKNLPFSSLCEHHLLPFYGVVHVAYIANEKILGLSKFPRNLAVFAHRWQVQEQLTREYGNMLMSELDAKGVAVMIEASHSCMTIRGAKSLGETVTTHYVGDMNDPKMISQFLKMIGK